MTERARKAEIAGGGLAGLALAAALGRNGWRVVVHEAADELRSGGGGLYISRDGLWALDQIGQRTSFIERSFAPTGFETWINERLHRSHRNNAVFRTTLRNELHHLLATTARNAGVEIRTASRVVEIQPQGALTLADGSRREADLVVAADGVGSEMYSGLGFEREKIIHNDGLLRVLFDRRGLGDGDWETSKDFWSYEIAPLRILYSPCSPTHCYLVMMASKDDAERLVVPPAFEGWIPSFPTLAPLLSRMPIEARCDRYGSIRLSSWVNDRAAVIGDAAHAMPSSHARGANISIRNAVELANTLVATDDVSEALSRWQTEMRPKIAADQEEAEYLASSRSLHKGFPKIDLDDLVPANMKTN